MCGIAGKVCRSGRATVDEQGIRQMLAMIRHRGPDQFGIYLDEQVGLGSARLSIIDLSGGQQPIANESGSLWIVFNGEIFNYRELRAGLQARGHQFKTESDTETILHLYEESGPECLKQLNGQFAIAIWDAENKELFLARDRMGVRPLFYARTGNALIFASEIKAILATGEISAEIDVLALDQIFTFWSTLSPRTIFNGIVEVPPGHYVIAARDEVKVAPYWKLSFEHSIHPPCNANEDDYLAELRTLLVDAVRMRLRADVPIGAYLSGGLDSSMIASIIRKESSSRLDTFSIAFSDEDFDESVFQKCMAKFLGTDHQVVLATHAEVGEIFPEVIWHTETPIMRTSPAPMFLLSQLVRKQNYKVVLTGEGADELLGGYDIFKEMKVRLFCARDPQSKQRQLLFQRLYPDIKKGGGGADGFAAAFFADGATRPGDRDYSHAVRWRNNRRTRRFFSEDVSQRIGALVRQEHEIDYPAEFDRWGSFERAQYLESSIFLSQYLLSSQGDRMGMANSVEGRFPFLDHRVVEFCTRLPSQLKMRGLNEKYLLKKLGQEILPENIWTRSKRPYRAPIHRSFFNETTSNYVRELLSSKQIAADGIFKPGAVAQLTKKIEQGGSIGETDDMALAGIISTQLLQHQFVSHFTKATPLSSVDDVKVCRDK